MSAAACRTLGLVAFALLSPGCLVKSSTHEEVVSAYKAEQARSRSLERELERVRGELARTAQRLADIERQADAVGVELATTEREGEGREDLIERLGAERAQAVNTARHLGEENQRLQQRVKELEQELEQLEREAEEADGGSIRPAGVKRKPGDSSKRAQPEAS